MSREWAIPQWTLVALIAALLVVGVISGTLFRHAVQVVPAAVAGVFLLMRVPWSSFAALPVFLFWLLIVALIWLYVLGIARVVTGRFTAAELALTGAMALSCVAGIPASLRASKESSLSARVMAFLLFAALQVGAMWLSFQPSIAGR